MDYEQALEWVHSLPRLAAHPGVENTRRLLEKLGNPEKSLRFVHVAGTNGKGSATVMRLCAAQGGIPRGRQRQPLCAGILRTFSAGRRNDFPGNAGADPDRGARGR